MSSPGNAQAFLTYWLLALGAVLLLMFIAFHSDDILDLVSSMFDALHSDTPDENDPPRQTKQHRRKKKKWKKAIRQINRQRKTWEDALDDYWTKKKCVDAVAETLATHQEILEEMYGSAPSASSVERRVTNKYRSS